MVFLSTTFLFLFLPAVFFFYWLPDVFIKIKLLLGIRKKSEGIEGKENNRDKRLETRDKGFVLANESQCHNNKAIGVDDLIRSKASSVEYPPSQLNSKKREYGLPRLLKMAFNDVLDYKLCLVFIC